MSVIVGGNQTIQCQVFDSLKSLELTTYNFPIEGAIVKVRVQYPSNTEYIFEDNTNNSGTFIHSWKINDGPGLAKVIVKVSKENRESSELLRSFNIRST